MKIARLASMAAGFALGLGCSGRGADSAPVVLSATPSERCEVLVRSYAPADDILCASFPIGYVFVPQGPPCASGASCLPDGFDAGAEDSFDPSSRCYATPTTRTASGTCAAAHGS